MLSAGGDCRVVPGMASGRGSQPFLSAVTESVQVFVHHFGRKGSQRSLRNRTEARHGHCRSARDLWHGPPPNARAAPPNRHQRQPPPHGQAALLRFQDWELTTWPEANDRPGDFRRRRDSGHMKFQSHFALGVARSARGLKPSRPDERPTVRLLRAPFADPDCSQAGVFVFQQRNCLRLGVESHRRSVRNPNMVSPFRHPHPDWYSIKLQLFTCIEHSEPPVSYEDRHSAAPEQSPRYHFRICPGMMTTTGRRVCSDALPFLLRCP